MVTKSVTNSFLVLRIVALATSAATIALLVTNNSQFVNGAELSYQYFTTYSLEVAIAAITLAYCVMQLPFAIYYAIRQERLIDNGFLPEFDFYGDKVNSLLLAVGVGAGLAFSVELKKYLQNQQTNYYDDHYYNDYYSTYYKTLNRGFVASAFLLVTFLSMTVVSFISSNNRSKRN